ncbi:MAG: Vitamin B12 dependent methionine synthase, activation domain [Chloroflexi bacterium ADurb.Bin180]|nr:MAG: Vitamin B12 dependent methionine synthase, activation domain [Chloroflexi bacterium ADurb.Bin180]
MPILRDLPIVLTPELMYAHQGRSATARPLPEHARAAYRRAIEQALELAEPAALYELFDVASVDGKRLLLANGQALSSALIVQQLARAKRLAVAVCTVGARLPAASSEAFRHDDSLRGFLLDTAGSLAVGMVSLALLEHLAGLARDNGQSTSFSIAPGSAECTLEDQRVVFDLLPAQDIGVRLMDSLVMVPIKSVSLVVGIGLDMPGQLDHSQCDFCPRRETCPSPRLRQGAHHLATTMAGQ